MTDGRTGAAWRCRTQEGFTPRARWSGTAQDFTALLRAPRILRFMHRYVWNVPLSSFGLRLAAGKGNRGSVEPAGRGARYREAPVRTCVGSALQLVHPHSIQFAPQHYEVHRTALFIFRKGN